MERIEWIGLAYVGGLSEGLSAYVHVYAQGRRVNGG